MPNCIAGKRKQKPRLDDFVLIGPRIPGCERNNSINMVSVYKKTAEGVCKWGYHEHKTLVSSVEVLV